MAASIEEMQRRVGQETLVLLAAHRGDDPVLAPPDDQGRRLHPRKEIGQPRVEHVGLPGEPGRHLPVARGDVDLVGRGRSAIELGPFRNRGWIMHRALEHFFRRKVEDVQDLALRRLEPSGGHEDEPIDPTRMHCRQFCGRPAANGMPKQVHPRQPERVEKPQIEPGEVVDALHPVRGVGLAKARVGGRVDGVALGHRGHPSPPASVASGAVKDEQGIACPADERVHFDSADPDRLLARHHRHSVLLSRARRALRHRLNHLIRS